MPAVKLAPTGPSLLLNTRFQFDASTLLRVTGFVAITMLYGLWMQLSSTKIWVRLWIQRIGLFFHLSRLLVIEDDLRSPSWKRDSQMFLRWTLRYVTSWIHSFWVASWLRFSLKARKNKKLFGPSIGYEIPRNGLGIVRIIKIPCWFSIFTNFQCCHFDLLEVRKCAVLLRYGTEYLSWPLSLSGCDMESNLFGKDSDPPRPLAQLYVLASCSSKGNRGRQCFRLVLVRYSFYQDILDQTCAHGQFEQHHRDWVSRYSNRLHYHSSITLRQMIQLFRFGASLFPLFLHV